VFEVDTSNFKIDSANKKLVAGDWTLDHNGIKYETEDSTMEIKRADNYGHDELDIRIDDKVSPAITYGFRFTTGTGTYFQYSPLPTLVAEMTDPMVTGAGLLGVNGYSWAEVWATYVITPNPIQQSSRKVKHDINDMPAMGEKLDQLQPVTFRYNNDPDKLRYGLVYEDTLPVMPEICVEGNDVGSINYTELVPMLLKEVQSLRKRVAELEAKVNVQD
jgi:hypothetical protein